MFSKLSKYAISVRNDKRPHSLFDPFRVVLILSDLTPSFASLTRGYYC